MLNSKMAYRSDFQYLNIFGSWGHFWGPRKLLFKSAKCNPFGKCTELLSRKSTLEDVWKNNFLLWNQMQIENILQFWDISFDIVLGIFWPTLFSNFGSDKLWWENGIISSRSVRNEGRCVQLWFDLCHH